VALETLFFPEVLPEGWVRPLLALGVGAAFGFFALRLRFLDASGAVAGGLFAASLVGFGGWAWAAPGFAFFFLSSLLSKLGRGRKAAALALSEKGSVRDARQVLANGGVAWALLLGHAVAPGSLWYAGFLGALAAAAADTWATEIGTLGRARPRLVTTWREAPPGTSGAVSALGTLGAALGAASVAISAWPFAPAFFGRFGPGVTLFFLTGSGVVASFGDSLAGAAVQARYRDPATGAVTERRGEGFRLVHGLSWIDNDGVNLWGAFLGALLAMACFRAAGLGS